MRVGFRKSIITCWPRKSTRFRKSCKIRSNVDWSNKVGHQQRQLVKMDLRVVARHSCCLRLEMR